MAHTVRKSQLEIEVELRIRAIEMSEADGNGDDIPQPTIRILSEADSETGVHWMLGNVSLRGAAYVRTAAREIAREWEVERREALR
ncbi:hypothetical protein GCM10009087_19730 [Sphingomonas oligophenolica]